MLMLPTLPFLIMTDSYKAGHAQMYPDCQEMTAYMECRKPFPESSDNRLVFYGTRYLVETILSRKITLADIEEADAFFATYNTAKTPLWWPKDLWLSVVQENEGVLPFRIEALPEGTVFYPHVPFLQITAQGKYARLVTWLETVLMHLWSPICTATKSRLVRDYLQDKFVKTVDDDMQWLLDSRLHDFGYRGVSSTETAMVTGAAHLLSFDGTDNMPAAWLATQFNNGKPIGESVAASEHSVMTAWEDELAAVKHLIKITPEGNILSVVADSYDYENFLRNILPIVAPLAQAKKLLFVIRPDSGDPLVAVDQALYFAGLAFGYTTNSKGFKVLNGAGVIQGDGIDFYTLCRIADMVEAYGWSAQNIVYGMGGGLLQKQNRDTLSIAMKLSRIVLKDGTVVDKMKHPKTDLNKFSLPGKLVPTEYKDGKVEVLPEETSITHSEDKQEMWDIIWLPYGQNKYHYFDSFDEIRNKLNAEWAIRPKQCDVISPALRKKIQTLLK